jgi:hypothetical protein
VHNLFMALLAIWATSAAGVFWIFRRETRL